MGTITVIMLGLSGAPLAGGVTTDIMAGTSIAAAGEGASSMEEFIAASAASGFLPTRLPLLFPMI